VKALASQDWDGGTRLRGAEKALGDKWAVFCDRERLSGDGMSKYTCLSFDAALAVLGERQGKVSERMDVTPSFKQWVDRQTTTARLHTYRMQIPRWMPMDTMPFSQIRFHTVLETLVLRIWL